MDLEVVQRLRQCSLCPIINFVKGKAQMTKLRDDA
jgi:hypothetical protein